MDYIEKAVAMLDRSRSSYGQIESRPDVTGEIEYTQSSTLTLSNKHLKKNHILTAESDKVVVNAYKVLRTRVLQQMQQIRFDLAAAEGVGTAPVVPRQLRDGPPVAVA